MLWKVVIVLGILGFLLGLAVAVISLALVPITNGRTSFEEAMIGFVPGMLLLVVSFFASVIGSIFVLKNKKSN
jgi:zinc transporter ZupT